MMLRRTIHLFGREGGQTAILTVPDVQVKPFFANNVVTKAWGVKGVKPNICPCRVVNHCHRYQGHSGSINADVVSAQDQSQLQYGNIQVIQLCTKGK